MIIKRTNSRLRTEAFNLISGILLRLDVLLKLNKRGDRDCYDTTEAEYQPVVQISDDVAGAIVMLLMNHPNCINFEEYDYLDKGQSFFIESDKFYVSILKGRGKGGTFLTVRLQPWQIVTTNHWEI